MIQKVLLYIFFLISFYASGQKTYEYNLTKDNIRVFDEVSEVDLVEHYSGKIVFGYSKSQQRFIYDMDDKIQPDTYYRINIKGLEIEGNSSPAFFIQFYKENQQIKNVIFNIHQGFYVIKTPREYDRSRLVISYFDGAFSFNSILFSDYSYKSEEEIEHDKSLMTLILPIIDGTVENTINFSKNVLLDSLFESDYYKFGNYYYQDLWSGVKHTRTEQRWVQGFFWLLNLIDAYIKTDDIVYLEKSKEIINIWKNYLDTEISHENKMIWHDETTARRLFAMLYAYDYLKVLNDPMLNNIIELQLRDHASKLSQEESYTRNNNHGMFQSLSMYAYSLYNDWDSLSNAYHDLALARIMDYFLFTFTYDGISKENTPSYHYLISKQLGDFIQAYKAIEEIEINKKLSSVYEKSKFYSINLLQPNDSIPTLGDNTSFDPKNSYGDIINDNSIRTYKLNNVCFKETGYAIMRKKWHDPNSFYLFFSAAYHHWSHKHNDDLSFLMTFNGNDILIDCSFFGYEYDKDIVKFGYSSFAHNSLVVDDESLGVLLKQDKKYSDVGINEWNEGNSEVFVKGFNRRWRSAEHYRSIKWNLKDEVVVTDSILSKDNKNHNYKLLYHFDKNIIPILKNNKVILELSDKQIATIKFNTKEKIKLQIFKGDEYPIDNFKGYHCESMGDYTPVEHYVLIIEYINVNGLLETIFKLKQ
ncbi:MAG: heparinase II/III-family protein [Bacteroidales bacterium]